MIGDQNAEMADYQAPIAPVQVEAAIREIAGRIAKGVRICSDRLGEYRDAERAYDQAFARAYMSYDGAAHAKRYAAELAVADERAAKDAAEVAWRYADKQAEALREMLRAHQSLNASLRQQYSVAGIGEGA